jgi:hypothetical protein
VKFFSVIDQQEKEWKELENKCLESGVQLIARSNSSPNRRVYGNEKTIYKIVFAEESIYENSLKAEYKLLQELKHIYCVPEPINFCSYEDCSILSMKRYYGLKIGQFGDQVSRYKASCRDLIKAILVLNRKGLRHGDIHVDNLLFLPDGVVKILDYDQAVSTTPLNAFIGDFIGMGKYPAKRCVFRLFAQLVLARLPTYLRGYLFMISAFIHKWRFNKGQDTPSKTKTEVGLTKIWRQAMLSDANAPGKQVSYYSLVYGKSIYQGERPWEPRWAAINRTVDFKGKRLLELGCNLGLLSCYAQHAGALPGGMAIDCDPEILKAANKMADFTGAYVRFSLQNFDAEERWEDTIQDHEFDIVSALCTLKWLKEKDRFLGFLGRFPELLYEGHDSIAVEVSRLNGAGFCNISIVMVSERGRAVLLAKK